MCERRILVLYVGNACWLTECLTTSKMDFHEFDDNNFYDNDEYDEFLFNSIKRYNVLQMFNLDNVPEHLFQLDEYSICVVSKRINKENSELLKLRIPLKLTLPPELESRSKDNDFKVLSGCFTEGFVCKADKLSSSKIITSEENTNCLKIYDLVADTNTKLDVENVCGCDFVILKDSENLILYKTFKEPLTVVDIKVEKKLKEIENPFYNFNAEGDLQDIKFNKTGLNCIKCSLIDSNLLAILNMQTGDTVLHDLRTEKSFINLPKVDNQSKEIWTLSKYDYNQFSVNNFGLLSNKKSFCIYDKRSSTIVTQNNGNELPRESISNFRLKFSEFDNQFSISGMDGFVEIFKINKNNFEHIFTHNGHSPGNSKNDFVTDHMWLKTSNKEYIVSVCNNRTLNCWDFNIS